MKTKLIFLLIFFLTACRLEDTRVQNPQPRDVSGRWEGFISGKFVSYIQIYIKEDGTGFAIASNEEYARLILEFDSFQSAEKSFSITVYFLEEGERSDPEIIKGVLDSGELCFYLPEKPDEELSPPFCFEKYKKINKYRKLADKIYRKNK